MSAVPEKASSTSSSRSETRSDVLVIGGGPVGCRAALEAAMASREVMLGYLSERAWMVPVLDKTYERVNQLADWVSFPC